MKRVFLKVLKASRIFERNFLKFSRPNIHFSYQLSLLSIPSFKIESNISLVSAQIQFSFDDILFHFFPHRRRYELKSPDYYTKRYSEKLESRCKMQLKRGASNCEKSFNKVHQNCLAQIPDVINYVICSPLKIDFICEAEKIFTNNLVNVCDPSKVIDADFGYEYAGLREKSMKLKTEYRNISFNYKTVDPDKIQAIQMLKKTGAGVSQTLNEKVRLIDYVYNIFRKLLLVIYLKIIYGENISLEYFF